MANSLLSPEDLATFLDDPVDATNARLIAAVDDAWASASVYMRFNLEDLPAGYRRVAAQVIVKRIAARFFKNPMEASGNTINRDGSTTSFNTLVGPRLLTDDEREQLDGIGRKDIAGMI